MKLTLVTRWLAASATWAVLATAVAPARAEPPAATAPVASTRREPTAGDLATARAALREGLVLRDKGALEDALARLASAYDLVPTPVTGFELGKTHMMLGHVLQAHELFKKVVRMAPSLEESTRSQTSRDEAARLARELEPRIPSLRLELTLPAEATAIVRVDDEEIPVTGAVTMRAVDPGAHEIVAKAGDGPDEVLLVEVAEGEVKDVHLAPTWVPPKPRPSGREIIYVRQTNPLAFIGFGIASAALVVTTVATFVYIDARDEAKDKCGASYCPPAPQDAAAVSMGSVIDTSLRSETLRYQVSGAIMVAAGVTTLLFTGVGIFGAARPVKERVTTGATVRPRVGLGGLGLAGTF